MSIKSIKIKNLLSFDELIIDKFEDINCIVGKNNAGKSNLLKLLRFFYKKLEGIRELPPELNSKYSAFGSITITYTISHRIKQDLKRRGQGNLFVGDKDLTSSFIDLADIGKDTTYELTLKVYSNDSIEWSEKNHKVLNTINYLYPFFDIEARYLDLHNWDKLWFIISRLKSFNLKNLEKSFKEYDKTNNARKEFEKFIKDIEDTIEVSKYTYQEKVLSYIKMRLYGDRFLIDEQKLDIQSDGTNAYKFIELSLKLLISLTRREYITPIIYVDEPEIGLHPKKNEELIENVYDIYSQGKDTTKTPYPTIIFATHSPNIVKQVIKLFDENQQILHFSKENNKPSVVQKMNSQYDDKRFLNVFSDNEARLFFSNFIVFVEGETELEIFRNKSLFSKFEKLKKVDVYATNDVVLKYINPAYANTAIPYLTIYDLDKLFDIDLENKKMIKRNTVISFSELEKKYDKAYASKKKKSVEFDIYQNTKFSLGVIDSLELQIEKNIFITGFKYKDKVYNYNSLIDYVNENVFIHENKFFNHTTIEELLINKKSIIFFKKWFKKVFIDSICIVNKDKKKGDNKTLKTIQTMMEKYPKDLKLKQVFDILFDTSNCYKESLPNPEKKFVAKIKTRYFKSIERLIDKNFSTDDEYITLFLLLFNGKTQTLISRENKKYEECIDETYRKLVKDIRIEKLNKLDYLFSKTSGWATSFLNFSIDEIENMREDEEFRKEFEIYFRELYDIITIIENKI